MIVLSKRCKYESPRGSSDREFEKSCNDSKVIPPTNPNNDPVGIDSIELDVRKNTPSPAAWCSSELGEISNRYPTLFYNFGMISFFLYSQTLVSSWVSIVSISEKIGNLSGSTIAVIFDRSSYRRFKTISVSFNVALFNAFKSLKVYSTWSDFAIS